MRIAIAGGTGMVGRRVVTAAAEKGHETVILSRSHGIDLMIGIGLADALSGADAVIDVTSTPGTSAQASARFFGTVTHNLLEAERVAGIGHHVALSIIGAAAVDADYYAGKAEQERMLFALQGGWSMLRASQFHEFAQQLTRQLKVGPLQLVPTMRSQPVAAAEVAAELLTIVEGGPQGLVRDLAGPHEELMSSMVRRYLRAIGSRSPVIQIPIPGAWGRSMRDGSLLPGSGARLGAQTFDEWIETVRR